MLVLGILKDGSVYINDDLRITVIETKNHRVVLGFEGDKDKYRIVRDNAGVINNQPPKQSTPHFKIAFWFIVVDCLTTFHGWDKNKAIFATDAYQLLVINNSLIYHEKPFAIACEIANDYINIADYSEEYETIMKSYD